MCFLFSTERVDIPYDSAELDALTELLDNDGVQFPDELLTMDSRVPTHPPPTQPPQHERQPMQMLYVLQPSLYYATSFYHYMAVGYE